jgi:hypothetical protein
VALAALGLSFPSLIGCSRPEIDAVLFEDVTASSGLSAYRGMTHGAAWGDFDGDGLPDLYVTNHLNDAQLFRNLGQGRFQDVTAERLAPEDVKGDKHGAAWADFDNDGRQDLAQMTGAKRGVGAEPKRLLLNRGERFQDVAAAIGVGNPEGRTRMPLWVDLDRDGRLDLFEGADARLDDKSPPFMFMERGGHFDADAAALPLPSRGAPFCVLAELNHDEIAELVCRLADQNHAATVADPAALPARILDLLPQTAFEDAAVADFDNDGWFDVVLVRKNPAGPVALAQPAPGQLTASLAINAAQADKPAGFRFRAAGPVRFRVDPRWPKHSVTPETILLGSGGGHPDGLSFELSPATPGIAGRPALPPGVRAGLAIGFTAPDLWEVQVSAPLEALKGGKPGEQEIQVAVESAQAIAAAAAEPATPEEAPARLFMNHGGKLEDEADRRGLHRRLVAGINAAAGDFDNDMDVDLLVLASGDVSKQDNLLFLNRGDGHFDVVRAAGGAGGGTLGVGDSVTAADFDQDGDLDLLQASGGSMGRSLGLPSDPGGYKLFRNRSQGRHWLEIDLEGTRSNRDGIGAIVRVSAGGKTQMRLQDGGIHHRGQNHARLHIGLGAQTRADKITVHWPSGAVQELAGQEADRIVRIQEPTP